MKALITFPLLMISLICFSQEKLTANTLTLAGQKSAAASIEEMAWIAGHWTGEAFGGEGEEFWSKPMGGAMMGCYRAVKGDSVGFYEMMIIREVENSLLLQIKHYNNDLKGWEEKDESTDFAFIKKEGNRVYFDGFTFENNGPDEITIYVAMEMQGQVSEMAFPYTRKSVIN